MTLTRGEFEIVIATAASWPAGTDKDLWALPPEGSDREYNRELAKGSERAARLVSEDGWRP